MTRARVGGAVVAIAFLAALATARYWPTRREIGTFLDSRPPDLSRFDAALRRAAAESRVDADLLRGLVAAESGGNPRAESGAGARGLAQLIPETAKGEARALGIREPIDLFDADTNLRLGARHLARLLDDFDGDVSLALAGYNAGKGNAARWRMRAVDADGAGAVRREGFPETRHYVARVLRFRDAYRDRD